MYTFVQKFHSGWAYLALLLLVFAVINSFLGMNSKKGIFIRNFRSLYVTTYNFHYYKL